MAGGAAALLLAASVATAAGILLRDELPAGDALPAASYPWPNFRGVPPKQFGSTEVAVPKNLSSARRWSWHHPEGRYHITLAGGPVIDADGSFYLGGSDGIRKLSPEGKAVWHFEQHDRLYNNEPALYDGKVFGSTQKGVAFALDANDGSTVWMRKLAEKNGGDAGYPAAYDGVFVVGAEEGQDPFTKGGHNVVYGLRATDGATLWSYRVAKPVWNFSPLFPGQDNVVFMDFTGSMYSLGLHNGTLLWRTPTERSQGSFSDGGAVLGPEGDVFSCSNPVTSHGGEGEWGLLRRLRVSDGALLWGQVLPQPCNSYPAVGRLSPGKGLSVVVTPGSFMGRPNLHGSIMAFDTATGKPQWRFNTEAYTGPFPHFWAKGDTEGLEERQKFDSPHAICLPAHWSSANIDGNGFVYAGRSDGYIYGVRAPVDLPTEDSVSYATIGADFASTPGLEVNVWNADGAPLHGAFAFAPGTVAFATCDTLHVFNA